jgi:4-amino-4-deoxy-L-arabinose transferase-like glycosyltransferase
VRLPTIAFTLMLGLTLYGWATEMFGRTAGLLALFLFMFDPTSLAHGKQVTSDMATAFFTVFASWAFWRLLRGRGGPIANLVSCGLATAGALVSKYTSFLLLPVFLILLVAEAVGRNRKGTLDAPFLRTRIRQAVALGIVVLVLLNAAYLFRGTLTRADAYAWQSQRLAFLAAVPVPIPLPKVYVQGLDRSALIQENFESTRGYNYVWGRLDEKGHWYAFPLMLFLKTPLALFALIGLSAWHRRGRPEDPAGPPPDAAFLFVPFLTVLVFFSFLAEPQLGIRYLLPGLPFLLLYAAAVPIVPTGRRRLVTFGLLAWYALSTLSYFPHPMSYFNELIGRRLHAWRYLADSNLDWEDRTRDIERYQARHPERPLVVDPKEPTAGWVLVAANQLVGIHDPERFRWLRENFQPVEHVGYSYLLFDVTPDRLQEVLARQRARPGEAESR